MRPLLALALTLAACGPRAVLGGAAHRGGGDVAHRGGDRTGGDPLVPPDARAAGLRIEHAPLLDEDAPPSGVVISRLPAPHREPPLALTPATADSARALVGHRDPRPPLAFALDVAAALTGAPPPPVADGPALVAWATAHERWAALPGAPLAPGDLVVLDGALEGAPASLVAVVLGTDARGVTDVVYLARGVVRRGHVDPARPTLARDRDGRVVNSYVRHGSDHPPPGTRYLAGELLAGRVRL